ncbi:MAG TPA: ABC transporter ATP-binding protein, partial [Clostridia bacterium]|nr:ABC transporter ATP-binding protein [Clostridia bacterium]
MKKNTFVRLFSYVKGYHFLLAFSAVSAFLSVLLTLIAPLVIGRSIDQMKGIHHVDFTNISKTLFLLILIYLGSNLFLWLLTFLTNKISYRTVNKLRKLLFEKLNTLPLLFFDRNPHGDTISRFVNDTDIISDGMLQGFMALLSGILTIVGAIAFMIYINPGMTLVVVLSAPASYFVTRFIAKRSQQLFGEQAKELGLLNGYAEEMIQGQKVVKAFSYEDQAYDTFRKINSKLYNAGVKSQFISSLSNPSTRIVNNITYALIGIIGGVAAISGEITVGDISSFLIYAIIFSKPFNDITNVFTQLQSAVASAQRVFHILDLAPETLDAEDAIELRDCNGNVAFQNVRFSYNPGQRLVENFNLEVPSGSSIAIVGHTGAGKTTLVNLLMRFYDIDGGSITIDGTDIRKIRRDSLRSN